MEKQRLPQLVGWRGISPLFTLSGIRRTDFSYTGAPIRTFTTRRVWVYIAFISHTSYAIYPLLDLTIRNMARRNGTCVEKYLKRPILFLVLTLCTRISGFYYELEWLQSAKKLTRKST